MRILQVVNKSNGRSSQKVYVDGLLFIDSRQPVEGWLGWKDGDFNIVEVTNLSVELARMVNLARDNGDTVEIDTVTNIDRELFFSSSRGGDLKNRLSREEVVVLADDFDIDYFELIDMFLVYGMLFDWHEQQPIEIVEEVNTALEQARVEDEVAPEYDGIAAQPSTAETYQLQAVDENKPIDVPLTAVPAYTPSYQAEESRAYESSHSYDTGSSHDSGSSSYDSGSSDSGSSDCGGGSND